MPRKNLAPERIRLSEALIHLQPIMSRSTFYGSGAEPGPRWTMVAELDIREGPPINMDRTRFFRWLRRLRGEPASSRQPRSERLGERAAPARFGYDGRYGLHLAALCRALETGKISEEMFQRSVRDLEQYAEDPEPSPE